MPDPKPQADPGHPLSELEYQCLTIAVGMTQAYASTLPKLTAVDPTGQSVEAQAMVATLWHDLLTNYFWLILDKDNRKDFPLTPPAPTPAPVPAPAPAVVVGPAQALATAALAQFANPAP